MVGILVHGSDLMDNGIPRATYRLQFTSHFTFYDAAAIIPYLKKLGITHLYASPFMKARRGSTHGYDIVDHNVINPELGGEDGFNRLSTALKSHEIGLILDFVPNHMGVHYADNAWWLDVLEWGQGQRSPPPLISIGTCFRSATNRGCCFRFWDRPTAIADARRNRTEV